MSSQVFIFEEESSSLEYLEIKNTVQLKTKILPNMGLSSFHGRSAEIPQGCHSHGISGSHRNRKYRKSCEKAWLRRVLAQLQVQEIGTN